MYTHKKEKKKKAFKCNRKDGHQITMEWNKRGKEEKKIYKSISKTMNKIAIRPYVMIITLNVNGLNAPTKRYRLTEWI